MTTAWNNRAMARLKLGAYQDAEADCTAVLEREPVNVKALLRRATARESLGRTGEAERDLRAALEADPRNKEVLSKLDAVLAKRQAEPAG